MPMMKAIYDHQIHGTHGHTINCVAGAPIQIPEVCVPDAIAARMTYCDDADEAPAPVVVEAPATIAEHATLTLAEQFKVELDQAITKIIVRADPEEFKSDNTPKVGRVVSEMDQNFRRPTATEISDAFLRLQENIDLAD